MVESWWTPVYSSGQQTTDGVLLLVEAQDISPFFSFLLGDQGWCSCGLSLWLGLSLATGSIRRIPINGASWVNPN